jgi:ribonuclease HI
MYEPWLRKEDGKWIQSPQAQGVSNLYVNQLWLPNRKAWDSNKIQLMFSSHVANSILTVPLFDDVEEDQLVWDDDKFGNYSVKSGYNLLLQEPLENLTLQANEGWKWLWKIQAPPKTKHLLWRLCKGCLPTRVRLKEKQVNCSLNCPLCESEEEDDWHVIYGCEYSKRAWQAAGVEYLILPLLQQGISTKDRLLKLCRNSDVDEAGKVATLLWLLWQNRNNWIWNNEKELGQQLGIKAMQMWHDWKAVQRVYAVENRQEQQHIRSWQAPPQGIFKCNVDAGLHVVSRRTSAGWCVRDFRGYYVLGGSSWIHGICSSNVGEALALLGAMQELQQRGFHNVIFETDAHNIVHAIRHRYNGESEFSSIINKIKCMLSSNLGFEVKPIRRQANMIAHSLARAAFSWPCRRFSDFIPSCINSLLVNEMI